MSNFHISTPSPLFNVVTTCQCIQSLISTLKRGRKGCGYWQKQCFLRLQKDTDRERLLCSNVSTLLSQIVSVNKLTSALIRLTWVMFSLTRVLLRLTRALIRLTWVMFSLTRVLLRLTRALIRLTWVMFSLTRVLLRLTRALIRLTWVMFSLTRALFRLTRVLDFHYAHLACITLFTVSTLQSWK